jgi:hypothetical protein
MKSVLRLTAAGVALATLGFASNASAATASASARAEIMSTLTVTVDTNDNTLDFGQITPQPTLVANSTVIVATNGTATCGANLGCAGTTDAPTFNVTGLVGSVVAVTFPAATATLSTGVVPSGMTGTMQVGTFTTSASSITLVAGNNPFTIGGTLTVGPLQAPGLYTGAVAVRVEYN